MTKEEVAESLSLSCVEAYFLAYFKNFFDVRPLYVQSFVPFDQIVSDFSARGVRYEQEYVPRVQDLSQFLGFTRRAFPHEPPADCLTLLRANEKFFEGLKRTPWRKDHYIAWFPSKDGGTFASSYPLSSGHISDARLRQVTDGGALRFCLCDGQTRDTKERYAELSRAAFGWIRDSANANSCTPGEIDALSLRDAVLFLRTTRRRLRDWLAYEGSRGALVFDETLNETCQTLVAGYDRLLVQTEYRLARGDRRKGLREELCAFAGQENTLLREIVKRRKKYGED